MAARSPAAPGPPQSLSGGMALPSPDLRLQSPELGENRSALLKPPGWCQSVAAACETKPAASLRSRQRRPEPRVGVNVTDSATCPHDVIESFLRLSCVLSKYFLM